MKISKWIASNKIVIVAPLLMLFTAVVFVYAYTWSEERKTNPAAAQSYPAPTIKTVDESDGTCCSSCKSLLEIMFPVLKIK